MGRLSKQQAQLRSWSYPLELGVDYDEDRGAGVCAYLHGVCSPIRGHHLHRDRVWDEQEIARQLDCHVEEIAWTLVAPATRAYQGECRKGCEPEESGHDRDTEKSVGRLLRI